MFVRKSINGSVKWIGIPSFLQNTGPPWTLNILDPYDDWGGRGSVTSKNLSSGSGRYYYSIFINCNRPARVLPIYHWRIFENTCSATCCACDDLLIDNHLYRMQRPSTCCKPIHNLLVDCRDDTLNDRLDLSVRQ